MLDSARIVEVVSDVIKVGVAGTALERILVEPAIDSVGNDALRIMIILRPDAFQWFTGDEALDLLVAIQQKLSTIGEERFPIIEYSTEQELVADAGQE